MKNKFERLTKDEKKQAIAEYSNASDINADVVKRLKRVRVLTIIGIIYAIINFIYSFLTDAAPFEFILSAGTLIACVILFIKATSLMSNNVNKYLITKTKKK